MSFVLTPYMNLPVPTVGQESGPNYAFDVNSALTLVDSHDHSPGRGVQITPAGININTDLPFNDNNATSLKALVFTAQASPLTTLQSLYVAPGGEGTPINDLWYTDGAGNEVQLTKGGFVNAIIASLPGESYAAGTFTWKQGTGSTTPANFDIGAITIRPNIAATTNGITIQANNSIATAFTLTLPISQAVASNSFLTQDATGQIYNNVTVDGTSVVISGNQIMATTQVNAATQSQVNAGVSTNTYVSPATLADRTRSASFTSAGTFSWTVPAGVTQATIYGRGGAGGGGSGEIGTNASGGGGGGGVVSYPMLVAVSPAAMYTIIVGAGGAGGVAPVGTDPGNTGSNGNPSSFNGIPFNNIGIGGGGGTTGGGGGGGVSQLSFGGAGGAGSEATNPGGNGGVSIFSSTFGTGGASDSNIGAGGGGGAGDVVSSGGNGGSQAAGAGGNGLNGGGGGGGRGAPTGLGTPTNGGNGSDGSIIITWN